MKIKFLLLLIVMCSCENKPQTFLDLFSNSISKEMVVQDYVPTDSLSMPEAILSDGDYLVFLEPAEPAGNDRNRQRGTLVAQGGRQGRTERRDAPPELGPGPQPQQLFGVDHETGQAAAGRGQLHSQHGHPQLHRSCACALPGNLGIQRL